MQREGQLRYAASAGQYRASASDLRQPGFFQGSVVYGLPWNTSVYGGTVASDDYQSVLSGIGHGFGDLGSVSLDVTRANTRLIDSSDRHTGQSYRLQYAKVIDDLGTAFTLAGYRYSGSGFYDFIESNQIDGQPSQSAVPLYNNRSEIQLNISQSFGDAGSLYFSGFQRNYWGENGYERSFSAGYNLSESGISYGLSYTYTQASVGGNIDQQLAFSVQMPLSRWLPNSWATYNINTTQHGAATQQAGISGTALADNNLNYNVQQSYGNRGVGASGNASATYQGTAGTLNAGYNYNQYNHQINYGVQGGIVAHPFGITLSQPLGDTLALVRAPGAGDVQVLNNTGVYTDGLGYAVVPYAMTYRQNRIALDPSMMGEDVDIDINTLMVTPTQGALVLADFKSRIGNRIILTITHLGQPVPFASMATLISAPGEDDNSGITDGQGRVYLSGMPDTGRLKVRWGTGSGQQCLADYSLPAPASAKTSIRMAHAICR